VQHVGCCEDVCKKKGSRHGRLGTLPLVCTFHSTGMESARLLSEAWKVQTRGNVLWEHAKNTWFWASVTPSCYFWQLFSHSWSGWPNSDQNWLDGHLLQTNTIATKNGEERSIGCSDIGISVVFLLQVINLGYRLLKVTQTLATLQPRHLIQFWAHAQKSRKTRHRLLLKR